MSAKFDKSNDNNNGDWITADDATKMTPTFPFSVSLWVRFEANVAGTETIWFYGEEKVSGTIVSHLCQTQRRRRDERRLTCSGNE